MNILEFYFPEWGWVAVNLVILTVVLTKILWRPVTKILNDRQERVVRSIADIAAIDAEKEQMTLNRAEYTAQLEAQTIEQMKDARTRAGREYDRIIGEAEEKAQSIINVAKAQAEHERDIMRNALKAELITDAIEAAGAFLSDNLDSDGNERLIGNYISRGIRA